MLDGVNDRPEHARIGTPADVAALVAFMVSPRGRWLHGATIDMDGGEVKAF